MNPLSTSSASTEFIPSISTSLALAEFLGLTKCVWLSSFSFCLLGCQFPFSVFCVHYFYALSCLICSPFSYDSITLMATLGFTVCIHNSTQMCLQWKLFMYNVSFFRFTVKNKFSSCYSPSLGTKILSSCYKPSLSLYFF